MKIFKLLFSILVIFNPIWNYAQVNDLTITVSDKMINKLLTAIGPVKGSEDYKVMMFNGTAYWTVENSTILLDDNKAWFEADVKVETGNFAYSDRIKGSLKVFYNNAKDQLELSPEHIYLNIKTRFLGKERLIETIDLANYYKSPFVFDGPTAYIEEFEFEMPDGSIKKLKPIVRSCDIKVIKGSILIKANVDFVDATKVKPNPPITASKTAAPQTVSKKKSKKEKRKERKKG
jgi:hypothetical protein